MKDSLRSLPSVSALIDTDHLRQATLDYGAAAVAEEARRAIESLRGRILAGDLFASPPLAEIAQACAGALAEENRKRLRPVINATGVLLHTGLGRAPLAEAALAAIAAVAGGYCNLEFDIDEGVRRERTKHVGQRMCGLIDAEAAHVVNNNAAATGLAVAALAGGRELIVSHGELIEIGGGFRLPEVVAAFGAILRPVGATNRTRASDYAAAIGERTGAMMVVHPSNYQVVGFTQSPLLEELVELARRSGVPLIHDIGSGAIDDWPLWQDRGDPIARKSLRQGVDLVLFSGDKLLGGPQCGILAGRAQHIRAAQSHPFNRALRIDKGTLAALEATLDLYRRPAQALAEVPLLNLLSQPIDQLQQRAERLALALQPLASTWTIVAEPDKACLGGGAAPRHEIPSWSVAMATKGNDSVNDLARELRLGDFPIVGRIQQDRLLICLQGVFASQDTEICSGVIAAVNRLTDRTSTRRSSERIDQITPWADD